MDERLAVVEDEEEKVVGEGRRLIGSMIGRRRVALTWAVGEAWERFSTERAEVVHRSFRTVGLSLPIDGSEDHEISIKGLANHVLVEGLRDWERGNGEREEIVDSSGTVEKEELDFHYQQIAKC